jgi:chromosome segregation ATPase
MNKFYDAYLQAEKLEKSNERLTKENQALKEKLRVNREEVKSLGKKYEKARHDANRYLRRIEELQSQYNIEGVCGYDI